MVCWSYTPTERYLLGAPLYNYNPEFGGNIEKLRPHLLQILHCPMPRLSQKMVGDLCRKKIWLYPLAI